MVYYPLIMAALMAMAYIQSEAPNERPQLTPAEWTDFKVAFDKIYASDEEELLRQFIFLANKVRIGKHNRQLGVGFELGVNSLSDRTEQELSALHGFQSKVGAHLSKAANHSDVDFLNKIINSNSPIPDEVDWRKVPNRVSAVKEQGLCGSGWAFSAVGALEGQEILRNKTSLITLSAQNLVDCVEFNGCSGGLPIDAFGYVALLGIEDEKQYPYRGSNGKCTHSRTKAVFFDYGWAQVTQNDERALQKVVANYGPVSAGIDARSPNFHSYKDGIYADESCQNDENHLNHGVLVVGYGTDKATNTDYWIVKNSWGDKWGEQGYFRLARNANNMCGIATDATFPTFKE